MKKLFCILLMLFTCLTPVYADEGYTITIPSTIDVNTDQSISYSVDSWYLLDVSVSSANGNKLKNGSDALSYTPNATSWSSLKGSGSFNYRATLGNDIPVYAGEYSDTLTFTAHSIARVYSITRVANNFNSYTVTKKGVYALTFSCDGSGGTTTGGTATKLYDRKSNGNFTVYWAEVGQTITSASSYAPQLVFIDGFYQKPDVNLLAFNGTETNTISASVKKGGIYLGAITLYSHQNPGGMAHSFTCANASVTVVDHPNSGWSQNSCALVLPSADSTFSVYSASGYQNEGRAGYIVELVEE